MLQTTNYQLCQWEPSDRILRADFNRDNEKIDTALAAAAGQSILRPIREIAITEEATTVRVQLDDIDWSQWQAVVIDAELLAEGTTGGINICILGNTDLTVGGAHCSKYTTAETERRGPSRLILFCNGDARSPVNSLSIRYSGSTFYGLSQLFHAVSYLDYTHTNTVPKVFAGSKFQIWGVK